MENMHTPEIYFIHFYNVIISTSNIHHTVFIPSKMTNSNLICNGLATPAMVQTISFSGK